MKQQKFWLGIFDDEHKVLKAAHALKDKCIPIHDVYTPYPVHGMDDAMQIKRSRLPIVTFFAGLLGLCVALSLQLFVTTIDWPIIVGGKPFNAFPAYVPISFELTVLFGGLITVGAFFYRSRLFPGAEAKLVDSLVTDNHFVIAIADTSISDKDSLSQILTEQGATEVRAKEMAA